jgi:hypothetical protein
VYDCSVDHPDDSVYDCSVDHPDDSVYNCSLDHPDDSVYDCSVDHSDDSVYHCSLDHPDDSVYDCSLDYHYNSVYIVYCFTSRSRIFHLYGDVTIAGEGLQNLGLCSALRAFEQGGIFIVPRLLRHGTSVFPVSSAPFSRLLRHTRGCGGHSLTRILTGLIL